MGQIITYSKNSAAGTPFSETGVTYPGNSGGSLVMAQANGSYGGLGNYSVVYAIPTTWSPNGTFNMDSGAYVHYLNLDTSSYGTCTLSVDTFLSGLSSRTGQLSLSKWVQSSPTLWSVTEVVADALYINVYGVNYSAFRYNTDNIVTDSLSIYTNQYDNWMNTVYRLRRQ